MIPQIKEIEGKFPKYATLSKATVTLNDMGDKTISTQIKIDGGIAPDFSYDWEVEFQGERYIQPLREPQASKGNDSICSIIDLTFYHKTIYDLKRYFFVEMASTRSGTAMADKYIADLNVNLGEFKVALQRVLDYYHEIGYFVEPITINLNPDWQYAEEKQYVQIQYTHIWDVIQKIYEIFGVRWSIEGREIKIGYPTEEVTHTFEYGFEGGLLKVERQVQSADIRNSLLGRGGSKNLPYRYFKETDPNNPSFQGDPDAIPELADIYFTELRGKTFRDYVKGWKAKHYGGTPMSEPTEAYTKGYTDTTFNPIEYVEDKGSIDKYGLLQGGLENQEDIYPTIQGVEVDGLGRVDEIVGAEKVLVDEPIENEVDTESSQIIVYKITTLENHPLDKNEIELTMESDKFRIPKGSQGAFSHIPNMRADVKLMCTKKYEGVLVWQEEVRDITVEGLDYEVISIELIDDKSTPISDVSKLPSDTWMRVVAKVKVSGFPKDSKETHTGTGLGAITTTVTTTYDKVGDVSFSFWTAVECKPIIGEVLGNYSDLFTRKSETTSIKKGESSTIIINSDNFEVPEDGATNVDVPINIIVNESGKGLYEFEKTVKAINVDTNEKVSSINIPKGKYYLQVSVDIRNISTSTQTYKVELMPSYVYYPTDSEEWQPTFDIWVKNIWGTTRNAGESDQAYVDRVWTPILGDREGNEAKVVFTTGWLAGHSDYEFVISSVEYAGGSGVELGGVPAEWKITLIKSDAEIEATGKWIPSTTQQANVGDKFFFIGIDMPHEYTLWAEQAIDNYKADKLIETAHIKPTWVVQTDKVRLNQLQEGESELLLNALKIGDSLRLADTRFTNGIAQTLYLQSVTYNWQEGTNIVPDVEVVLSDKVTTSTNPVAKLQGEIDALTKQVGSISNIQQVVRAIGDKLYLRKDGFEETSNSPTKFNKLVSSRDYRQGAIGGNGWGLRSEQGKGVIEVDKLIVRDEMQVNSLVVNQVSAIGGKEIFSAASIECSKVEVLEQGFKCYFDQKRGSVANLFQVHDIAYSQVFNPNNVTVKYYKREVIEVGDNYILLSLEGDGNGAPQEGDVIAQYGNTENQNRQFVIIRDVIGGGYERMLSDLNSVDAEGTEYYFAGRLDGGKPRWFVGNAESDYAEWKDGTLNIKGKLAVGSDVGGATVVEGGLVTAETIALGSGETINAGITGKGEGDDAIRFWAGATEGEKGNAPFKVFDDGTVVVKGEVNATQGSFENGVFRNVTIVGSLSSPFEKYIGAQIVCDDDITYTRYHQGDDIGNNTSANGMMLGNMYCWKEGDILVYTKSKKPQEGDNAYNRIGVDKFSSNVKVKSYINKIDGVNGIDKNDNIAIPITDDKILSDDEITWDVSNSGRVIRLVNSSYDDVTPTGKVMLIAPSGKYFFEDGERYTQLIFSREVITLIGYGTKDIFYGWIVLNRKTITTANSYGCPQDVLYQGVIRDGVLTKFWSPHILHTGEGYGVYLNNKNGVVTILVSKVDNPKSSDYRGLEDTNNWAVIASSANVHDLVYVQGKEIGENKEKWNCIEFNLDYSGDDQVVFQVISTADWANLTATTNE